MLLGYLRHKIDFIWCIGDDNGDENMFAEILNADLKIKSESILTATVGLKPS